MVVSPGATSPSPTMYTVRVELTGTDTENVPSLPVVKLRMLPSRRTTLPLKGAVTSGSLETNLPLIVAEGVPTKLTEATPLAVPGMVSLPSGFSLETAAAATTITNK